MATTNHTATPASAPKPARRFVGRQVIVMQGTTETRAVIARAWIAKRPLTRNGLQFSAGHLTRARVVTPDLRVLDVDPSNHARFAFVEDCHA